MLCKKRYFDFVIIVLIYKNYKDLEDFIYSMKNVIGSYKIIIVNSYFDDESNKKIKMIAEYNSCDFIRIPNKGYSFGNNTGIRQAFYNYQFQFLIISNPDIIINKLDINDLKNNTEQIVGPQVICKTGKNQNPLYYRKNLLFKLNHLIIIKSKVFIFFYFSAFINKIIKLIWRVSLINKNNINVYALHGSFIIFSYDSLLKLNKKPFNEKMFLFAEEDYLGFLANKKNIVLQYNKNIIVHHKEDGSIHLSNINKRKVAIDSLKILYTDIIPEMNGMLKKKCEKQS